MTIELVPENDRSPRIWINCGKSLADVACVLPVGNRTKPSAEPSDRSDAGFASSLRGIIEYEPSEFTFTAGPEHR